MKTSTLDPSEIKAIPTVYNGIQLRSRMEAKCCLLFDKMGWQWEYEPFSVNLDGIDYMPDFYIKNRGYVVECRGYDSANGNAQLAAFSSLVTADNITIPSRKIKEYLVIGPDFARGYGRGCDPCYDLKLVLCPVCEQWRSDIGEDLCGECGYDRSREFVVLNLEVNGGQILIDGEPSSNWRSIPWALDDAWMVWIHRNIDKAASILSLAGFEHDACWLRGQPLVKTSKFPRFGVIRGDIAGHRLEIINAAILLSDILPKYFWVEE